MFPRKDVVGRRDSRGREDERESNHKPPDERTAGMPNRVEPCHEPPHFIFRTNELDIYKTYMYMCMYMPSTKMEQNLPIYTGAA